MSDILKINWKDLVKGLILAVFTAVLTAVYEMLQKSEVIEFKKLALAGLIALTAYLIKQLGTDTENKFLGKIWTGAWVRSLGFS